jgi:hypothetical protein
MLEQGIPAEPLEDPLLHLVGGFDVEGEAGVRRL